LKQPVPRARADGDDAPVDEDSGGAAGLGDVFGGVISGVRNALNLVTYYQMKARAGQVGTQGLNPVLRGIAAQFPALRLHLVGHSFGGRLVTAATAGADAATLCPVASLSLLQAAFSHYGFAENWEGKKGGQDGFFRRVMASKAVRGPVIATCTANDKAVGLAYPLASMLAQQVGAELGDKNDKYGGMGRNGAQKTPEAVDAELLASDAGRSYDFSAGHIHNLQAGNLITGHGDVRNAAVAYAVLSAMAAATA
jgi:pimeloyl-ACP methyl ester carboxylesterase